MARKLTGSHRPSFKDEAADNVFWSMDRSGEITIDGQVANIYELATMPENVKTAFVLHAERGYHPDCVICQGDPRAVMEMRASVVSGELKSQEVGEAELGKQCMDDENEFPLALRFIEGEVFEVYRHIYPHRETGEIPF